MPRMDALRYMWDFRFSRWRVYPADFLRMAYSSPWWQRQYAPLKHKTTWCWIPEICHVH